MLCMLVKLAALALLEQTVTLEYSHLMLLGGSGWNVCKCPMIGKGRNTVSRVLFRKGELAEFRCEKLGEFALAHK